MDHDEDSSGFLAFASIRFASTAILAPLENAKILQQVSYLPSDDFLAAKGYFASDPSSSGRDGSDHDRQGGNGTRDADDASDDVGWASTREKRGPLPESV